MDLISVLQLLGGVGLFLYGMSLLGASLERVAGASLEKTLEKLTNNRIKGVALGAVVTGVIQSSAATVVMVVGFVNAGIMKLAQAVPVIMGANIGTTVTGQILRLGDIGDGNILLTLLKPSSFAPVCIGVGAGIMLISKRRRTKDIASIIIGLGILFFGMTTMESTLSPLKESETFQSIFFLFKKPFLGILLGAVVTAVLQSSSAAVGVLQAISSTGRITFSIAAPIILGMNIGKCVTVLIASIGTNKQAKRAVSIDVIINLIGVALFTIVVYSFNAIIGFSFWDSFVNRSSIANFHTLFNVVTSLVLLPFSGLLIKLSSVIIKDREHSKIEEELALLDDIFIKTPSLALEQSRKVILSMGSAVKENFEKCVSMLENYDERLVAELDDNERFLDKSETMLVDYLVKITSQNLSDSDSRLATELMHTVGDFERIGDYCINILSVAEYNKSSGLTFSSEGREELSYIKSAVAAIIDMTVEACRTDDIVIAARVEPLEETIDIIEETLKEKHISRLQSGLCNTQSGISFVEILTNMERIADHCSNIAVHILQRMSRQGTFDAHEHLRNIHQGGTEEYKALCRYYESIYCDPIK